MAKPSWRLPTAWVRRHPAAALGCLTALLLLTAVVLFRYWHRAVLLHSAASAGNAALCDALLRAGASVNASDAVGWTALHWAARNGNSQVIRVLLDHGATVNVPDRWQWQPLHLAVSFGHVDAVAQLIEAGADVHVPISDASMPVEHAQRVGYYIPTWEAEQRSTFWTSPARIIGGRNCGERPLHIAAAQGDIQIATKLLEAGADVNARNVGRWHRPVLHVAVEHEHNAVVKLLIERGGDVHLQDDNGATALHDAAHAGDGGIVRLLLSAGADPNQRTNWGTTPLHECCSSRADTSVIEALIDAGADLNGRSGLDGQTPLHRAAASGQGEAVRVLLKHGAEVNSLDGDGQTALDVARGSGVERFLRKHGGNTGAELRSRSQADGGSQVQGAAR